MIASPTDLPPLDVGREKQRMERALQGSGEGLVELTWLEGQTWRDLQRAMRPGRGTSSTLSATAALTRTATRA